MDAFLVLESNDDLPAHEPLGRGRDQPFNPGPNSRTPSMLLVKLGGSVITVKSKYRTLRGPDLSRLARELAAGAGPDTPLVPRAGSYGHILAAKHRWEDGAEGPDQLSAG